MATTTGKAWDEHRPPDPDLIADCVHCGFCLPTCPSYAVFEEEMDSPRGRIVLMRVGNEEGSEASAEMRTHFDRCLGCMACVTACPSGVQYDKLILETRPQVERNAAAAAAREAVPAGDLRALHPSRPAARHGARCSRSSSASASASSSGRGSAACPSCGRCCSSRRR